MHIGRVAVPVVLLTMAFTFGACAKSKPPVARPLPPQPGDPPAAGGSVPRPPEPVAEPISVPPEPRGEDPLKVSDIDKINQNSPFQPVFFAYDSSEIETEGQQVLQANAAILKKYPEWVITIEGHSDERGTAEYNLALGNRRAAAAKAYLISLGIPADRLRTVSYGKEFPFDPTHTESGWSKNRRAHFVLTSK
jgi:peptidoglycan-associated lipoprotein